MTKLFDRFVSGVRSLKTRREGGALVLPLSRRVWTQSETEAGEALFYSSSRNFESRGIVEYDATAREYRARIVNQASGDTLWATKCSTLPTAFREANVELDRMGL